MCKGTYTIIQGSFNFQCPRASQPGVYIGGRKDGTKPFVGSVHALEIYNTQSPKPIPQELKKLIIKAQQIDTINHNALPLCSQ